MGRTPSRGEVSRRAVMAVAAMAAALAGPPAHSLPAADHDDSALREVFAEAVRQNHYPGALAQARRPGRIHDVAIGVGDVRTGGPPRPDARFRAGSITKTFVATTVLQLVAERRIRLTDTVGQWLPGLVDGKGNDGGRITVRMLLDHTSGLFDYTNDKELGQAFERDPSRRVPPRALVRVAVSHPPLFRPGSGWNYSDTDYVLLGMIIQRVTGRSYAEETTRRIIRPLGLRSTYFPGASRSIDPPYLHGYTSSGSGAVEDVTARTPTFAPASGDLVSTVGDLNRFVSALLAGRLLPRPVLRQMLTPVPRSRAGSDLDKYGLGVIITRLPCGVTVYGHGGTLDGYLTGMAGRPGGAHTLAWVVNGGWGVEKQMALTDKAYIAEFCGGRGHASPSPSRP
ncbi:serine hydrolase domain-containing protein [Actinoallomurus soli]|uniref:serine hydrolase domain-containing protein n=1 Tax=Actinoallomurus soli TaxID=2952535 RepID=UPI002092D1C5|nr:serine hydrolase domain-containing protein [Actinoallomurus soli]MCO5967655.1 beta-lactamase family protein [Actinoallomurus soli]